MARTPETNNQIDAALVEGNKIEARQQAESLCLAAKEIGGEKTDLSRQALFQIPNVPESRREEADSEVSLTTKNAKFECEKHATAAVDEAKPVAATLSRLEGSDIDPEQIVSHEEAHESGVATRELSSPDGAGAQVSDVQASLGIEYGGPQDGDNNLVGTA